MSRAIFFVALGGLLGSTCRYLTTFYLGKLFQSQFPIGTFVVNVVGCFTIGIIVGLAGRGSFLSAEWRLLLVPGFCGGFTTFSAFAIENIYLLETSSYLTFALYSLGSISMGMLAVYVGLSIMR